MKKIVPWIFVIMFVAWAIASLWQRPEAGFRTREFGKLPVMLNGRIQPMDSAARNALLQIRARQSVGQMNATAWLMETMMDPIAADNLDVFHIDNPELLNLLQLPEQQKYYSFDQIRPHYDDLAQQAKCINDIEDADRSAFECQLLKLNNALEIYQQLKWSLCRPDTEDFSAQLAAYQQSIPSGVVAAHARGAGQSYDTAALNRLLNFMAGYGKQANSASLLVVPPAQNAKSRDDWQNIGVSLINAARGSDIEPVVKDYAAMVTAYQRNRPDDFNRAVRNCHEDLSHTGFDLELNKAAREFFFNEFQPFYKAIVIYVTAFLLALIALLTFALAPKLSETLRRSAFWLVILGGVIHTFGLLFRIWLEGRPPVTNLYSSAIFIGWGCVVLGIILERIFAVGLGSAAASFAGFVTLVIAHNLTFGGDTMEMLPAVLNANCWLTTHVVVVTLGYAATFMAGLLGITYVLLGLFTPLLKHESGKMELGKTLAKMVYGIICFATLFSFTGTVLGGIWADQSWGRFWGWDPKENGALLIVLWNAIILHARWGGIIRERGLMNMVIFGNIVTSWSWFGVNMLGIGLHSYGFMDAGFKWLVLFAASQIVLIILGMLPVRGQSK